ncbi:hypothetical protein Bbelb_112780 [Branchiostoma belcheri]|nr:hypothetical protein Bbelb_112780 [Branchiostoma belcheri]
MPPGGHPGVTTGVNKSAFLFEEGVGESRYMAGSSLRCCVQIQARQSDTAFVRTLTSDRGTKPRTKLQEGDSRYQVVFSKLRMGIAAPEHGGSSCQSYLTQFGRPECRLTLSVDVGAERIYKFSFGQPTNITKRVTAPRGGNFIPSDLESISARRLSADCTRDKTSSDPVCQQENWLRAQGIPDCPCPDDLDYICLERRLEIGKIDRMGPATFQNDVTPRSDPITELDGNCPVALGVPPASQSLEEARICPPEHYPNSPQP